MIFLITVCVDKSTVPCCLSTVFYYINFLFGGMCIAAFLRNCFKLLCKQSFEYKTEIIRSLLPSEESQLLELFACMASIKFSCVYVTSWASWWSSGEESAYQCRGHRFNSWPRKILHVVEQLSLCTTTAEPGWALEPVLCNKRSDCNKSTHHSWRVFSTRHNSRKAGAAVKTQHSQK